MVTPKKAAPAIEITLLEDYWPCAGGVTQLRDPINSRPTQKNSASKHQIQLFNSVENEEADAGWDGQPRLARPNSQAHTGIGKKTSSCSAATSIIGNNTQLIHTLLQVITIYKYIHAVNPILPTLGNPFKSH